MLMFTWSTCFLHQLYKMFLFIINSYFRNYDYFSLRILGCAYYPYLRPYNRHKLELELVGVSLSVTVLIIKAINVFIFQGRSMSLIMIFLMNNPSLMLLAWIYLHSQLVVLQLYPLSPSMISNLHQYLLLFSYKPP